MKRSNEIQPQPDQGGSERTPEMRVLGIDTEEYRSGIPLSGWQTVKNALYEFAGGHSRRSRAAEGHNVEAYGQMHPLAGAMFLSMNNRVSGNEFVDEMLNEAEPSVKQNGRWQRGYDYDGQGSFHKTTVEITALKEQKDSYLLQLNAAYVGKGVEDGLAEHLGVEQGLQWKSVTVRFNSDRDEFAIDFNQVLRGLRKVRKELHKPSDGFLGKLANMLGKSNLPEGERIAKHFMQTDRYSSSPKPIVLGTKGNLEVVLSLGRVGERFAYNHGERSASRWEESGSVLRGPLGEDYRHEGQLADPSIVVSIRRQSKEDYNRLPILDPKDKETANRLASKVEEGFRSR